MYIDLAFRGRHHARPSRLTLISLWPATSYLFQMKSHVLGVTVLERMARSHSYKKNVYLDPCCSQHWSSSHVPLGHAEVMSSVSTFKLYKIQVHSQQEGWEPYTTPLCHSFDQNQGPQKWDSLYLLLAPRSKIHSKNTLVFCGLGKHVSPFMSLQHWTWAHHLPVAWPLNPAVLLGDSGRP